MIPEGYQFQSDIVRNSVCSGKADSILEVLDARGLTVTAEENERILGCTDPATLKRSLRAAVTVASARELFE